MIQGIDHLVILVDDLDDATARYRDLGFTVVPGGKHPRGTHNALVGFGDGAYLELIAFWEPDFDAHPWHRHLAVGPGLIDYALAASDLATTIPTLDARGLDYSGPMDGARARPDGVDVLWKMGVRGEESGTALPFLIEDVTDRAVRVPGGPDAEHANGVTGIDRLIVVVDDLEAAAGRLAALLDTAPRAGEVEAFDEPARAVAFQTGSHQIELHQPRGGGPQSARLEGRGPGPYAVVLHGTQERDLQPDDTGGLRLQLVSR